MEKGKNYEKTKLQMIEEKLEKEIAGCTFKPKVNSNYKFKQEEAVQRHTKIDFHSGLYELNVAHTTKKDKTTDDHEFEKSKEECTFIPRINKPRPSQLS